ncbi:PLDc N-terminal domain-containing protein [Candidatus Pacearchaeota archaeon]|nr:PLDc N-terminal domain-containing protein [Candidatus Pacearchaeota archaeon]
MAGELTILAILGIILIVLALFALVIFLLVFWILMIVDCAKRKFKTDGERIAWILILIFIGIIGAIIYYFVVKRGKKSKKQ